jgi:hypothetical protein
MKNPLQLRSRAYERRKRVRCDAGYKPDGSRFARWRAGCVWDLLILNRFGASEKFRGQKRKLHARIGAQAKYMPISRLFLPEKPQKLAKLHLNVYLSVNR